MNSLPVRARPGRRNWLAVGLLLLPAALIMALLIVEAGGWSGVRGLLAEALPWAGQHPVLLYFLLLITALFPVPQLPVLILAGMVFVQRYGEIPGAALAVSAVALNNVLCYALVSGPLRMVIFRFLERHGFAREGPMREHPWKFAFLIRMIPVLPVFAQSYLLSALRIPFPAYLVASWSVRLPLAFTMVLTAGAILNGKTSLFVVTGAVLLLLWGMKSVLGRRLQREAEEEEETEAGTPLAGPEADSPEPPGPSRPETVWTHGEGTP